MPPSAPVDAQYLTLAANGVLTDYRILDVGNMLVAIDGGASGTYQLNVDPTAIDHNDLDQLTTGNPHTQYLQGTILTADGDILTRVAGSPANLPIGSAGQVLTVAAGLPSWATPAGAPAAYYANPLVTGRYYGIPMRTAGAATLAVTANRLYLVPVPVPVSKSFDQIAMEVTTFTAGNCRLGLYGPFTGSFASIPLVVDAGVVSTGTNGIKTVSITQTLASGWYLIAAIFDATPTVRTQTASDTIAMWGGSSLGSSALENQCYYAQAYGTLPTPSTGSPTFAGETPLMLRLRAS